MSKLTSGEIHLMNLIRRDIDIITGWTSVSEPVSTLVVKLPEELVIFEKLDKGGRAKLTWKGHNVLEAMEYL